jgi:DNA-binding MarR family transcriptional regulator
LRALALLLSCVFHSGHEVLIFGLSGEATAPQGTHRSVDPLTITREQLSELFGDWCTTACDLENQQSLWNVNWFCFKFIPRRFQERTMAEPYLEVISLVEQLHRQFLEIVKLELDGLSIHDLNNVQALMLFNIGDAEMSVGELTLRGCYLGSNVSYNVKKLAENGYIAQERSVHDRRSVHIKLTNKGRKLRDKLSGMHQRHVELLKQTAVAKKDLETAAETLRRLERFWMRASDLALRPGEFVA